MTAPNADYESCAKEPIHIPGSIQEHGVLLIVDDVGKIIQASANCGQYGASVGSFLSDIPCASSEWVTSVRSWMNDEEQSFLLEARLNDLPVQVVCHRSKQGYLIDIEKFDPEHESISDLYPRFRSYIEEIGTSSSTEQLMQITAKAVRRLTNYDRALVYKFDEDWHGTVIAEDKNDVFPSYLDLRFPASDVPAQARELYARSTLRIIPDVNYTPIPLEPILSPIDGKPTDLSMSALRSVSPVHVTYMRHMETASSFSISILVENKLWGLISCHNAKSKPVSPGIRAISDSLARIVGLQTGANGRISQAAVRLKLKGIEGSLLARVAVEDDLAVGLAKNGDLWRDLVGATGAAIVTQGEVVSVGQTPAKEQIIGLANWIKKNHKAEFVTNSLCGEIPEWKDSVTASGVVAIPVSQMYSSYIMWFRPEVIETVKWGGKSQPPSGIEYTPKRSFEMWSEHVSRKSIAWTITELDSARDFCTAYINFIIRRLEERAELTDHLERSNKELEAFSYSVSHDLRAPFRHIAGYAELLTNSMAGKLETRPAHYLSSIITAAKSAGRLVDDLLQFAQMGRLVMAGIPLDMNKMMRDVLGTFEQDIMGRDIEFIVGDLPKVYGDPSMLRQMLINLVDNSVKYTSKVNGKAVIELSGVTTGNLCIYTLKDNGIGFDQKYAEKLFGVFQRLHKVEDFPGTGIGLALAKRICERHNGWIVVKGVLNEGVTVTFALPNREPINV